MAGRFEESDRLLGHPDVPRERQEADPSSVSEFWQKILSLLKQLSCLPCNVCVNSKAAVLILVWSVFVGAISLGLLSSFGILGFILERNLRAPSVKFDVPVYTMVTAYAFLAIVLFVYPFSGYLADIHCGRYKAVSRSLFLLWIAMIFFSAVAIIVVTHDFKDFKLLKYSVSVGICVLFSVILTIVGLSCYQANVIQLGLDQLLEAPSEKLGLFLHWLMWSYTLGEFLTLLSIVFIPCYVEVDSIKVKLNHIIGAGSFGFLLFLTLLLTFTVYKRAWFYTEPGQSNPYKTVFKVLNFARKNKYPLRRSAFTFCDDFIPSRIDFAKERYGGPFTTPQVEDVKTFLRIVSVLLALGPVFVLEVPGSYYLFPLFALHIAEEVQFKKDMACQSVTKWVLLQSRVLGYIVSILFVPIYIWVVFSFLRRKIPKILTRLQVAFGISFCGVLSFLIIDLIGHFHYRHQHHSSFENATENTCLFTSHFLYASSKKDHPPQVLHLHWGVTILPNILLNFGSLLVPATTFEFISAQSPHSMKGLLVGVFFAIKGLFQFISAAAVVPFAIPGIWNSINAVTNCGFGYYLFTIVVALVGLVVFSVVVRRYRYRERDERPFDTRFAERYYERYLGSSVGRETERVDRPTAALHSPNEGLLYHGISINSCECSDSEDYDDGVRTRTYETDRVNRPTAALHSRSEGLLYHDQLGITVNSRESSSDSEDYDTGVSTTNDSKLAHKLPDDISSKRR